MRVLTLLLHWSTAHALARASPGKTMDFLRSKGLLARDETLATAPGGDEPGGERARAAAARRMLSCAATGVIDDLLAPFPGASCGTAWTSSSDRVMGGVSQATMLRDDDAAGRRANVLRGRVSTANSGGFVSMGLDLAPDGALVDAREWDGVELTVRCPRAESYNVHLRTPDCARVFSSYRASFATAAEWRAVRVPWAAFSGNGPGAAEAALDVSRLRRISLLGIGREFDAELALADLRFYKGGG